nr:hydrogenase maturation protease [Niveibacterium umoris]
MLVLAFGNPGRGDDAVGPLLGDKLAGWLVDQRADDVEVVVDFQLNIEHALDLVGRRRVLFIDARASGEAGARFESVSAQADASYSTHAVSPQGLLEVHAKVVGGASPRAEILSVRGESFELGAPLSAAANEGVEAAWRGLIDWVVRARGVSEALCA